MPFLLNPNAYVPLAGGTSTGEQVAPDFKATGKTGATDHATILAGGTASGAPTTGAHVVGELVTDGAGAAFCCTVAGTPGTWVQVGGGASTAQWFIDIDVQFATPVAVVGSPAYQIDSSTLGNGVLDLLNTSDEASWDVVLAAGTWTVEVMFMKFTNRGDMGLLLDGTSLGTIATNGSLTYNVLASITGIVVATSGKKRLTLRSLGTGGGTRVSIQHAQLRRTA